MSQDSSVNNVCRLPLSAPQSTTSVPEFVSSCYSQLSFVVWTLQFVPPCLREITFYIHIYSIQQPKHHQLRRIVRLDNVQRKQILLNGSSVRLLSAVERAPQGGGGGRGHTNTTVTTVSTYLPPAEHTD